MRPIKTVLLLQDLQLGGTQRHALELARRLDPARFAVELWTLAAGGDFLAEARRGDIAVRELSGSATVGPASLLGLWRELGRRKPQALLALTVVPNIWGRLFGRLRSVPAVIANCRGGDDLWRQHETLTRHLAHAHICNAQALKTALMERYRLPAARVEVIPTGVDTQHFHPDWMASPPADGQFLTASGMRRSLQERCLRPTDGPCLTASGMPAPDGSLQDSTPEGSGTCSQPPGCERPEVHAPARAPEPDGAPVLLCLARLAPIKDHETLVRAFEILHGQGLKARLRLAGDGELREVLLRRLADSPAHQAMELLPGRPDPRPLYSGADVCVLSSANEGMPNVLLEAMAMGLPCVGTAVGGVPEVIRSGSTGFVVPKKDPEALARALAEVIANPDLRRRFGRQGREAAVAGHSLETVARRHAEVIEHALNRSRTG